MPAGSKYLLKNKLALLPIPQRLRLDAGRFSMPARPTLGISDARLYPLARRMGQALGATGINIATPACRDAITLLLAERMKPDAYQLRISSKGIQIHAGSVRAAFYGWQTLRQVLAQADDKKVPCLTIDDWPALPVRGVYLDIARGRVPTLVALKRMADILARHKINQLSLYMQHTFRFRAHPAIGRNASPMTAEDILELDAYCRENFIELVPSLASFGHMETVLKLPPYRRLAEDFGLGLKGYVTPDPKAREWLAAWFRSQKFKGFTLSPANPAGYKFLDSLYAELLPLFSAGHFNVCCDETVDLGYGQSYQLCRRIGKGRVYIDHLLKLHALCGKHGKRMMCWGDILRHYPELAAGLPNDITILDWGYHPEYAFPGVGDNARQGRPVYACPSTHSYGGLFPRLTVAMANISSAARAAQQDGGTGLLNTIWGDGGHFHLPACEWHGLLFGAEQSWNPAADAADYHARFCRLFLRSSDRRLPVVLNELGEITQIGGHAFWPKVFFANPNRRVPAYPRIDRIFTGGRWRRYSRQVDAPLGAAVLERLDAIRADLVRASTSPGADPEKVMPAWIFAVDTLRHAARKLAVMGSGGENTLRARRRLAGELSGLMNRHHQMWMDDSRPSAWRNLAKRARQAGRCLTGKADIFEFKTRIPPGYITRYFVSRLQSYSGKIRALPYPPVFGQGAVRDFATTLCEIPELAEDWKGAPRLVYYHARLTCLRPMRLAVGLGYDGPVKVWLDRQPVWCDPGGRAPAGTDKAIVPLDLHPGAHTLCVALDANRGLATGIRARLWHRDAPQAPARAHPRPLPQFDAALS